MKNINLLALLGAFAAVFGVLNAAEVLTLLPQAVGAVIAGASVVSLALAKALHATIKAPRWLGVVGVLAAAFGTISASGLLALLPEGISAVVGSIGAVLVALAGRLQDTDGDGTPDILDNDQ